MMIRRRHQICLWLSVRLIARSLLCLCHVEHRKRKNRHKGVSSIFNDKPARMKLTVQTWAPFQTLLSCLPRMENSLFCPVLVYVWFDVKLPWSYVWVIFVWPTTSSPGFCVNDLLTWATVSQLILTSVLFSRCQLQHVHQWMNEWCIASLKHLDNASLWWYIFQMFP